MENLRKPTAFSTRELWEYYLWIRPEESPLTGIVDESYLTLARFQVKEAMEETLIRWIQNICRLQRGIRIKFIVKGASPAALLEIQDLKPLLQLANSIKIIDGFVQSNECPPVWVASRMDLSLPIHQPVHLESKTGFTEADCRIAFPVEKIQLVKRKGPYETFQLVNSFSLSLPVSQD